MLCAERGTDPSGQQCHWMSFLQWLVSTQYSPAGVASVDMLMVLKYMYAQLTVNDS